MKESAFQNKLINKLELMFPGCIIMKQDAKYCSGIPDLAVFYGKHYAMLECKASATASHQPNQDFYVDKVNKWTYAAFVYPENIDKVLYELQEVFSK